MTKLLRNGFATLTLAVASVVSMADMTIEMNALSTEGVGDSVGTITVSESQYGLVLTPDLKGLPPGIHGFHVHEKPNCGPTEKDGQMVAGLAAGGHFDPAGTGQHKGPYDDSGHLGDLPPLYVEADGTATTPVLAPRLKAADLKDRSLMLHTGGDNFSDDPKPLGGGGARIACGVIP